MKRSVLAASPTPRQKHACQQRCCCQTSWHDIHRTCIASAEADLTTTATRRSLCAHILCTHQENRSIHETRARQLQKFHPLVIAVNVSRSFLVVNALRMELQSALKLCPCMPLLLVSDVHQSTQVPCGVCPLAATLSFWTFLSTSHSLSVTSESSVPPDADTFRFCVLSCCRLNIYGLDHGKPWLQDASLQKQCENTLRTWAMQSHEPSCNLRAELRHTREFKTYRSIV